MWNDNSFADKMAGLDDYEPTDYNNKPVTPKYASEYAKAQQPPPPGRGAKNRQSIMVTGPSTTGYTGWSPSKTSPLKTGGSPNNLMSPEKENRPSLKTGNFGGNRRNEEDGRAYVVVRPRGARVRKDRSRKSEVIGLIPCGTRVWAVEEHGNRIRITQPLNGWCSLDFISGGKTVKVLALQEGQDKPGDKRNVKDLAGDREDPEYQRRMQKMTPQEAYKQQLEWQLQQRPSTKELMDKNILLGDPGIAPALQLAARVLARRRMSVSLEKHLVNRPSQQDLKKRGMMGFGATGTEGRADANDLKKARNNKSSHKRRMSIQLQSKLQNRPSREQMQQRMGLGAIGEDERPPPPPVSGLRQLHDQVGRGPMSATAVAKNLKRRPTINAAAISANNLADQVENMQNISGRDKAVLEDRIDMLKDTQRKAMSATEREWASKLTQSQARNNDIEDKYQTELSQYKTRLETEQNTVRYLEKKIRRAQEEVRETKDDYEEQIRNLTGDYDAKLGREKNVGKVLAENSERIKSKLLEQMRRNETNYNSMLDAEKTRTIELQRRLDDFDASRRGSQTLIHSAEFAKAGLQDKMMRINQAHQMQLEQLKAVCQDLQQQMVTMTEKHMQELEKEQSYSRVIDENAQRVKTILNTKLQNLESDYSNKVRRKDDATRKLKEDKKQIRKFMDSQLKQLTDDYKRQLREEKDLSRKLADGMERLKEQMLAKFYEKEQQYETEIEKLKSDNKRLKANKPQFKKFMETQLKRMEVEHAEGIAAERRKSKMLERKLDTSSSTKPQFRNFMSSQIQQITEDHERENKRQQDKTRQLEAELQGYRQGGGRPGAGARGGGGQDSRRVQQLEAQLDALRQEIVLVWNGALSGLKACGLDPSAIKAT